MNLGDRFDTRKEIKDKCKSFAYDHNFFFLFTRSEEHCVIAQCGLPGCLYQMRFFKSKYPRTGYETVHNYSLTGIDDVHTCDCEGGVDHRKVDNSFLEDQIRDIVIKDMTISIRTLINIIGEKTGITYEYDKIYKLKQRIIEKYKYNYHKCFQFIFSFINYINFIGGYGLQENNPDNTFKRAFVGLPYCNQIINFTRKFISLDGAHIKNVFKNTLLIATCLDSNNNIIILAYSIVPIEDNDNWNWFLNHVRLVLGYNTYSDFTFISDRDKGLQNALANVFPESTTTICLRHLVANLRKKVKDKNILTIFWKCATTFDEIKFNKYYDVLKGNSVLFDMIKDIVPQWARSQIDHPRFNQITSNISESINSAIRESRKYPDLDLLLYIYNYINDKFNERHIKSSRIGNTYTPYCTQKFEVNREMTINYTVSNLKDFEAVITYKKRKEDGSQKSYYVNLMDRSCTCGHFQDILIPCLHAGKLISVLGLNSAVFTSNYYKTETYKSIYNYYLPPIMKSQLYEDNITLCPSIVPKKGRPKSTKRKRSYFELLPKKKCI